ncbi:PQQ-dependent sugar dehydrogenase [Microbacterium schleiferi]|uniref:PQQ-dependent sugar dehydrogenase n=1 Tax=Microbacterium schleiferi TaxID=69362 RepID=UPI00311F446F
MNVRAVRGTAAAALIAAALTLTACVESASERLQTPSVEATTPAATPTPSASSMAATWRTAGAPTAAAANLRVPWSVVPFPDGTRIVSMRGGEIVEIDAGGAVRTIGGVSGVSATGEGGLLGLAVLEQDAESWLYAYLTSWDGNRVIRMPLLGAAGERSLGGEQVIFDGIPKANTHNGGRIAFGPDGYLYVATGDAGNRDASQDLGSLSGKILRIDAEGSPAPGNPFGTAVYSLGHRNVQGLAWTDDGTLWATEFGQDQVDEINRIIPGGNYGWPIHEGAAGDPAFVDPIVTWSTDQASPSGMAAVGNTLFVAALRGERVWMLDVGPEGLIGDPQPLWIGEFGRIRDSAVDGDELLLLTNNTDGRGAPSGDDDRLLSVPLVVAGP